MSGNHFDNYTRWTVKCRIYFITTTFTTILLFKIDSVCIRNMYIKMIN